MRRTYAYDSNKFGNYELSAIAKVRRISFTRTY